MKSDLYSFPEQNYVCGSWGFDDQNRPHQVLTSMEKGEARQPYNFIRCFHLEKILVLKIENDKALWQTKTDEMLWLKTVATECSKNNEECLSSLLYPRDS